jgi:hypothetical protein
MLDNVGLFNIRSSALKFLAKPYWKSPEIHLTRSLFEYVVFERVVRLTYSGSPRDAVMHHLRVVAWIEAVHQQQHHFPSCVEV